MQLRIRYFALFREQTGCGSEDISWPGGTAKDLFSLMAEKHSNLQVESAALVAITDEMVGWETLLAEGDEVLFFPPVAVG